MHNFFIVEKLTYFSFTFAMILKGFNFRTYYIIASPFFLKPNIFFKLRSWGIKTIEQEDFYPTIYADCFFRTYQLSLRELEEFKRSRLILKGRTIFLNPKDRELQKKFDVLLLTELEKKLYNTGKLAVVADALKSKHPENLIIINNSPLYSNLLKGTYYQICFPLTKYFSIFEIFRDFTKRMKAGISYPPSFTEETALHEKKENQFSLTNDYEIAYFPHDGVFYSSLFIKDFYYSNKENSPFHPSKLLHISLGDKTPSYIKSVQYYYQNSIPFCDLFQLPSKSKRAIFIVTLFKILPEIISDFLKNGPHSVFLKSKIFFKINLYLNYLKNLRKLKLVLITMETEFSQELSLALSIRNIQIVAVQDRFLLPFGPNCTTILDHYFVMGEFVKNYLYEHQNRFYTRNIHLLGNIKTDALYNYHEEIPTKYKAIKNHSKIVLILDFLMAHDFISSHFHDEANWTNGIKFYQDLYLLAQQFPNIHFVLKGKDNSNYAIPGIMPYFTQLEALNNFTIEKDLEIYKPHVLGRIADAALCLYTSMADELLAFGTPVFIYDFCGLPTKYFSNPTSVFDFETLKIKLQKWNQEGFFMNEQEFDSFREYYYSNSSKGSVKPNLQNQLEKIFDSIKARN